MCVYICVDMCVVSKSVKLQCFFTCKIVVSLHVHYHPFMNFDFLSSSANSRELSTFFSHSACLNHRSLKIDHTVCFVIDKPTYKIYENLFENNTIHFDCDCCCCCCFIVLIPQNSNVCFSHFVFFILIWSIHIPSLIKVPFIFLGASLICHIIKLLPRLLLLVWLPLHRIEWCVPLFCVLFAVFVFVCELIKHLK